MLALHRVDSGHRRSAFSPYASSDPVHSMRAVRLTPPAPKATVEPGPTTSSFIFRPNGSSIGSTNLLRRRKVRSLSQFGSNTAEVTLAAIRTGASIANDGGQWPSRAADPHQHARQTLDSGRVEFSNRGRHDRTNDIVNPADWCNRSVSRWRTC